MNDYPWRHPLDDDWSEGHMVTRDIGMTDTEKAQLAISLMRRAAGEVEKLAKLIEETNYQPADSKFKRAMEACESLMDLFDIAPDEAWYADYYGLTGEHWVCTEEGWIPADMNTREATGEEPAEVYIEVNAPDSFSVDPERYM